MLFTGSVYTLFLMTKFLFATTNAQKLEIARVICATYQCTVEPVALEIDEIQGEDAELILRDKAKRAFELTGKPVVVSDDCWGISALNGFPGAYMKSMNHWLTADDFLRLMDGLDDRRITLYQGLAYTDGAITKTFICEIPGTIMHEKRGPQTADACAQVVAMDMDSGKTIAEVFDGPKEDLLRRNTTQREVWHEFIEWYRDIR